MTLTRSCLIAPATLLVLAGCSSPSSPSPKDFAACEPTVSTANGPLPGAADVEALVRSNDVLFTAVNVAGTTGMVAVDTGSPFVLLEPDAFPRAPADGTVCSLQAGGATVSDVPVLTLSTGFVSPDPAIPVDGILGCPAFCDSTASFNYRDVAFTIGDATPPSDLEPATTMAFSLEGGGTTSVASEPLSFRASRVVVTVQIEGVAHRMIVDTGASAVVVNQATYADLTKDGRKQISSMADTTSGVSNISKTRAASITLGGVEVTSPIVAHDTSFDENIGALVEETGMPIDGSLGGTFLTNFFLTIDYPNEKLTLARYSDTSFLVDLGRGVGFSLVRLGGATFGVNAVDSGSDAEAKGVRVGDEVIAVDGQALASLTSSAASLLLYGKVGATKQIEFGAATTLANQTVPILAEELLPLP